MKKKLLMTVAVGLMCTLCYGCGNTNSTNETTTTEESASQDEVTPDEADTQEPDTTEAEEVESQEVEEAEPETETVYLVKKEVYKDLDGNITSTREYEYIDGTSNVSKETYTTGAGDAVTTYEYYDNGNLKLKKALNADGTLNYSHEYDEDGLDIKFILYTSSSTSETTYTYENGVKSSETISTDADGGSTSVWTDVYNEYGDTIKSISTFSVGSEYETTIEANHEYEYNSDGLVTKDTYTYVDSNMHDITEYTYDSNGNMLTDVYTSYEEDGSISACYKSEYEYDEFNNTTKIVRYTDDEMDSCSNIENTYDENNNLIKYVYTDQDGNVTSSYEAEYIAIELPKTE